MKINVFHYLQALYSFFKRLLHELEKNDILTHANAIAFHFSLAIFPALIFLFSLIPYIPITNLDTKITYFLQSIIPQTVYKAIALNVQDIVKNQRGGLLSFGFLLTTFLSSNGMIGLRKALNKNNPNEIKENFFKQRILAVLLTFMLGFVLVLAMSLLTMSKHILYYLKHHGVVILRIQSVLIVIKFLAILFAFFIATSLIYSSIPLTKPNKRFFTIGSLFSSLLSIFTSMLFSFYLNNFGNYNKFYGSLGMMIALMTWFFLLAYSWLLGFEINKLLTQKS